MTVYIIILIAMILATIVYCNQRSVLLKYKKKAISTQKMVLILLVLVLTLVAGARETHVGTDTPLYVLRFYDIGVTPWRDIIQISDLYLFEYGFAIYCKIIFCIL